MESSTQLSSVLTWYSRWGSAERQQCRASAGRDQREGLWRAPLPVGPLELRLDATCFEKGMGKGGGGLAALHLLCVSFLDLSIASCPGTMWQAGSARVQLLEKLLNPEQRDSATYCYRLVPGRVSAVRINSAWLTELLHLLDLEVKGKRKVF